MNPFVRFWLVILSLVVALSSMGYLSISFFLPESAMVVASQEARLGIVLLALAGAGLLIWGLFVQESQPRDKF